MKIDIIITPEHINEDYIKGKNIVVIDMLRATSVMTTAFKNGCKEVIPFLTVEEVFEEADKIGRKNCILGGERNAKKIDGFDLSNSPLEYTKEVVLDKTILMTTTNGTKALTKARNGKRVYIASILNGKKIAERLASLNEDVIIVNAGTDGEFTIDDFICGGYIVSEIEGITKKIELTDISKTAKYIYENNKSIENFITMAKHYKRMKELNLFEDIEFCIQKEELDIIPIYKDGVIKIER